MTMAKLMQLARSSPKAAGVRAEASGDAANVYIYDAIDPWFGVTAKDVVRTLNGISASTINLHINSPGGDVFEARAMKTALEAHPAKVVAYVDGLAASAASFLMLGADEIRIAKGAFVMIHNPWSFAFGEAQELRQTADLLDQIAATIARDYAGKTGASAAQIKDWMDAETWFEAEEAVKNGFCDAVIEAKAVSARHDLSVFDRLPEALKPKADANAEEAARADLERYKARLALFERVA
jgi:ATP-dependent Clp protease protease subunit